MFESNPQPMWVFDRDTLRFLAVNKAALALYGYTRREFLAMSLLDIRDAEDRPAVREVVDQLPAAGLGAPGTWCHRTKDGRRIHVQLSTHVVAFKEREAVLVLAHDVTAQREAHLRAAVQERELRALTEALVQERTWLLRSQEVARIGAWETDLQTLEVQWSEGTYRIFGLDPLTFRPSHTTFLDFVHPDDRARVDAAFGASFATRDVCTVRHRILPKGGGERIMEERWYTSVTPDGTPLRAYGTCQDVTEREAADAALRASEERFRTVFETAASGILVTALDGTLQEVNTAFAAMLGHTAEALRGRTFQSLTHPDDRDSSIEILEELKAGRRSAVVFEKRYLHRDGHAVWCRLSIAPTRTPEGRPAGTISVVEDISQQRAALDALRRSETQLQMASEIARIGAWSVELPSQALTISRAARVIQDLAPDEPFSAPESIALYAPEHQPVITEAFQRCIADGQPFDVELRMVTRAGRRIWVRAIGRAVRDAAEQVIRVEGALQDVTARVEAEERGRALEAELATTLDNISDAFFTLDEEWRFRFLNRQAELLLHRTRDELLGRVVWDEFPEARDSAFERNYRAAMQRATSVEFENYYAPLATWFSVRAVPSPGRLAVYFRNVNEERHAREQAQVSEERFRLLSRATNDAIWDWDLATGRIWWNEGFEALTGDPSGGQASDTAAWAERIHPDDRARVVAGRHEAIDAGATQWQDEYRYRRSDGRYAFVLDRGHIIHTEGRPTRMIGGLTDLSERRAAEERLAEQAALLDSAHEAIVVKGLDDRITYWNKGAERAYGWTSEEALGRRAGDLLGLDPAHLQEAWRSLHADGFWEGELRCHCRDGTERIVDVRYTMVRDEEGKPRAVFALHADVTERRRIESQFLRAQRLESLGTLAGGIAHDLNNVLTPVLAAIGLLRDPLDAPDRKETLDAMEEAVQRGAGMVRQVLMFARGAEGQRERVELGPIVAQVAKIIRETFPKSITLDVQLQPGLRTVTADSTQLHQVLLNLCVNARDAMPKGGRLTLGVAPAVVDQAFADGHPHAGPGEYIRLSVADEGTGIAPELQEHIFEPFFTTKELGQGTGLGLSTVHSIVRSHGGFVILTSALGAGTRFDVYLPADAGEATAAPAPPEAARLPRGAGEVILVVDDEDGIRRVIRRTLERFGYRVLEAHHGADGVAQFARHRRDIAAILTDLSMPVMDGPAMITAIHRIDPHVRIIASSGLAEDREMAASLGNGPIAVVPKPYTADVLLNTLHRVLHPGH